MNTKDYHTTVICSEELDDLKAIADVAISDIRFEEYPNLLIFPDSFDYYDRDFGYKEICNVIEKDTKLRTNSIVGFVGRNETHLSIRSRFAAEGDEDYFLHYMLQKVAGINLFNLQHTTNEDSGFDFLIYLFPLFLKRAVSQGIYKKYITRKYNDANVRGTIDVNRHIRFNEPFNGKVAYTTREYSYDNEVTQLIRHTIEFINKEKGGDILMNDPDVQQAVYQIIDATPSYLSSELQSVINRNLRPVLHPYYCQYTLLQRLCLQILRHEELKYGKEKDEIYGVLIDAAWLWEEYLNTVLSKIGFTHPRNKEREGGIRMFANPTDEDSFDNKGRRIYPDFYREDYILDAKYKHLNGSVGREDLYQVVSYMYCMDKPYGGYVYPDDSGQKATSFKLAGKGLKYERDTGGILSVIPFKIPQKADNWKDFLQGINQSESWLKDTLISR